VSAEQVSPRSGTSPAILDRAERAEHPFSEAARWSPGEVGGEVAVQLVGVRATDGTLVLV
jgi:hypothetical protein